MAISIVGTISPFNIEEINAIMHTNLDANLHLDVSVDGALELPKKIKELFPRQNLHAFNHPGLLSIAPTLELDVAMAADLDITGNFSTGVHAYTRSRSCKAGQVPFMVLLDKQRSGPS